jgi:hypothetical protein
MSTAWAGLTFLTSWGSNYTDFRPVIATGPDGALMVVFERTYNGEPTVLYAINDITDWRNLPEPEPFLIGSLLPPSQSRPDFCAATGQFAFNGALTQTSPVQIWQVDASGANPTPTPFTCQAFYPTWSIDGQTLVTANFAVSTTPYEEVLNSNGTIHEGYANISGTDVNGVRMFGGMPTVSRPGGVPLIAFAGQPDVAGWAGLKTPGYNQSYNYVFVNKESSPGVFTSAPMESGASIGAFDQQYQGRAPAGSPNGDAIAFESNRPTAGGYAIWLFLGEGNAPVQITDPAFNAQHAKFFPCGTKLIFATQYAPSPHAPPFSRMGIAWLDISDVLGP